MPGQEWARRAHGTPELTCRSSEGRSLPHAGNTCYIYSTPAARQPALRAPTGHIAARRRGGSGWRYPPRGVQRKGGMASGQGTRTADCGSPYGRTLMCSECYGESPRFSNIMYTGGPAGTTTSAERSHGRKQGLATLRMVAHYRPGGNSRHLKGRYRDGTGCTSRAGYPVWNGP